MYGPTSREEREILWEILGAIRGLWEEPWCLGGDFNVIRFPEERNQVGRISVPMRRFSKVIDELELKDLLLKGGRFTWKWGLNNQRRAKLDKYLVSGDWEAYFGAEQSLLLRSVLDHFPGMLVGRGASEGGPILFRFENMWLKADSFKNLIST